MKAVLPVGRSTCASSSGGESEASCEYRVEYDKRMYSDVANAEFEVGKKLGTAVFLPCDDSSDDGGGRASPDSTVAHAIEGVDTGIAIAVDDAPDDVLFVAIGTGEEFPPEVKKLIKGS
ncbi:DUF6281 family protein [Streptomyces sp. GESEQ-35]|uniref:DUF6281 family protein n=1 Tax=Streptomyces sp. GESEQ-35 TaxID=2812657 RepID=UPI001B31AF57|nr:DUF6281 family protein [Streptomyces sp. GESEQ-35]